MEEEPQAQQAQAPAEEEPQAQAQAPAEEEPQASNDESSTEEEPQAPMEEEEEEPQAQAQEALNEEESSSDEEFKQKISRFVSIHQKHLLGLHEGCFYPTSEWISTTLAKSEAQLLPPSPDKHAYEMKRDELLLRLKTIKLFTCRRV